MTKAEKFIKACTKIHENCYDYTLVLKDFKSQRSKIRIICKKHGEFIQTASNHKQGQKCRKCRDIMRGEKSRRTKEEFFKSLPPKHLTKYDYSLVKKYSNSDIQKFICPIHGEFKQTIVRHLDTGGCYKCGRDKTGHNLKKVYDKQEIWTLINTTRFKLGTHIKFRDVRENFFNEDKINLSCKYHGHFSVTPIQLKTGTTCKECRFRGYTKKDFIDFCLKKNKQTVLFYKILIFSENESFLKIGITSNSIKSRFRKLKQQTGYSYKILKIVEDTPSNVWGLENKTKKLNGKFRYTPTFKFAGHTECFTKIEDV